jgi:hypothetical protein
MIWPGSGYALANAGRTRGQIEIGSAQAGSTCLLNGEERIGVGP